MWDKAACKNEDTELFFPTGNTSPEAREMIRQAKAVCNRCSLRDACLDYALDNGEDYGIWGGMTEKERRRIQRHGLRKAS